MERLHIDILGLFVTSHRGNKYVLMVVDQFTKWMECFPVGDQSAESISDTLITHCLSKLGMPRTIHSDQGRNFDGIVFREVCRALEVAKTRTTPYRPCSNGQVERYNRTVLQMIRCYLDGEQKNWDRHLHLIGLAIRSTVNRTTGFTPNFLMLGREISLPTGIFPGPEQEGVHEAPEYVQQLVHGMKKAHEIARKNLKEQQRAQKHYYDQRMHHRTFQQGDVVYKLDTTVKPGQSAKLKPIYIGPLLVVKVISPVLYKVEDRRRTHVVHHDRIKQCNDREIPLWIRRRRHELLQTAGSMPSTDVSSDNTTAAGSMPSADVSSGNTTTAGSMPSVDVASDNNNTGVTLPRDSTRTYKGPDEEEIEPGEDIEEAQAHSGYLPGEDEGGGLAGSMPGTTVKQKNIVGNPWEGRTLDLQNLFKEDQEDTVGGNQRTRVGRKTRMPKYLSDYEVDANTN